jgi:hypothetical protein
MKLFAFYVGGKTETSNTELHDMRFAVGEGMEDCYESLRGQWWGTPESLHIDCWSEITHSDGYSISLHAEASSGVEKLFFANLGGYDADQFTELHSNVFVVAPNKAGAKKRALATVDHWIKPHRDMLFEVEHIIGLSEVTASYGFHIHLAPTTETRPLAFVTGCYIRLGAE